MKHFLEFMIEKHSLDKSLVVKHVLSHSNSLPSLHEVVSKSNIIDSKNQIEAFKYQLENTVSYKEALSRLGYWNKDSEEKILDQVYEIDSIYKNLVDNKVVTLDSMVFSLDEFIADYTSNVSETSYEVSAYDEDLEQKSIEMIKSYIYRDHGEDKSENTSPIDMSKYNFNFQSVDKSLLSELDSILTEEFKSNFLKIVSDISISGDLTSISDTLSMSFITIEGGSKFLRLDLMQVLSEKGQDLVSKLSQINKDDIDTYKALLRSVIEEIYVLHDMLKQDLTERKYWDKFSQKLHDILTG